MNRGILSSWPSRGGVFDVSLAAQFGDLPQRGLPIRPDRIIASSVGVSTPKIDFSTLQREDAATNLGLLSSQRVSMGLIALPKGYPVASIMFAGGTTALATGVHQIFGIYTIPDPANSSRGVLRGMTRDATSEAWAANTLKSLSLPAPYVTEYAGVYWIAILVQATTVPSLIVGSSAQSLFGAYPPPGFSGETGQSTLPQITNPATGTGNTVPWAGVSSEYSL
jgi:hypothetical protein